jgi:hypothetical protein
MSDLLSDKQKAWAGLIIGFLAQAASIIGATLMEGTPKTVLLTVGALIGTLGVMLGVYKITNKP